MVDIALEILASSVSLRNGYMVRYRVKTWWAHIDVPPEVTFIKLPRLPMIQPFLIMTGKDTTVFVETWQDHKDAIVGSGGGDGGSIPNKSRFLGMTTCRVDEQLKTPNLNPSVQWLDVHDPIEDTSRGKLLIKIDAKFVLPEEAKNRVYSPSRPDNYLRLHGGSHEESPIKMVQSPRRSLAPNFQFDYNNSPTSIQHISSRKSDTSVFSMRSSSSTRSQEQAVQTDLSLPIIPDISKYTAALHSRRSFPSGVFVEDPSVSAKKLTEREICTSGSDEISTSSVATAVPVVPSLIDPLKVAEDILKRNLTSNVKTHTQRRTSEPVPSANNISPAVSNLSNRRSCLVRQHVQQQDYHSPQQSKGDFSHLERRPTKIFNMESLEDVIDILNNDGGDHPVLSSQITAPASSSTNRLPASIAIQDSRERSAGPNSSLPTNKPPVQNSSMTTNAHNRKESPPPINSATHSVRKGEGSSFQQQRRFKEICFDGAQERQQATSILMTRTTVQDSVKQPVVTRRRIAAAIFGD